MSKQLTPRQQFYRKGLLAKIHQAPKYVNHFAKYKDDYRNMLEDNFGKRSAADLSINQLILLLEFLSDATANNPQRQARTTKPMQARTSSMPAAWVKNSRIQRTQLIEPITTAQINFIKLRWQEKARNPSLDALRSFIESKFGIAVIGLHALTKKQANGIINALNNMKERC